MSPFELVFVVFGLLLGLALSEVLAGFSRALKAARGPRPVRIGWLVPLLGLVVMLDLSTFWLLAWNMRDQVDANYPTLVGVLVVVGGYYLAATLIFPDAIEEWPDLDAWYLRQRRLVLGGLLGSNVASWIGEIALTLTHAARASTASPTEPLRETISTITGVAIIPVLITLLFVRSTRWNVALLLLLSVLLLVSGSTEVPG